MKPAAASLLLLIFGLLSASCAVTCGATPARLAALHRGMAFDDVVSVMGCPGTLLTARPPSSGEFAIVQWSGPESRLFGWTRIDFLDGRLLAFTTGSEF